MIEFFSYTLVTYLFMIAYSALMGWLIGVGVESQNKKGGFEELSKYPNLKNINIRVIAKQQSAFFVINTKYALLFFPALLVSCIINPITTTYDIFVMFIYCYTSTILLQMILQHLLIWIIKRHKGMNK